MSQHQKVSTSKGKDINLLEQGAKWIIILIGSSLVIAGFIVINLPNADIRQAVYSLLYLAVGFELLFIASIFVQLSDWIARRFMSLEVALRREV